MVTLDLFSNKKVITITSMLETYKLSCLCAMLVPSRRY